MDRQLHEWNNKDVLKTVLSQRSAYITAPKLSDRVRAKIEVTVTNSIYFNKKLEYSLFRSYPSIFLYTCLCVPLPSQHQSLQWILKPEGLILNTGTEVIFRSDSCQMRRQSDAAVSSAILTILFYAIAEDVFTTDRSERQ